MNEERRLVAVDVDPDTGWGDYRYEYTDQDEVQTVYPDQSGTIVDNPLRNGDQEPQSTTIRIETRQPRKWRRNLAIFTVGAIGCLGAGKYLSDHMPSLPQILPEADHELDVDIDAPTTEVVHDVEINFADVTSTFSYQQSTSLDRFGPFNCDANIDQEVTAVSPVGLTVETAEITVDGDSATVVVDGDIDSETFVDIESSNVDPDFPSGSVDVCTNRNEEKWAEKIAIETAKNAGGVGVACAVAKEGEEALEEAVRYNARMFSEQLAGINPENIEVEYAGDYEGYSQAAVNGAVAELYSDFDEIAQEYTSETGDHKDPSINASDLTDCEKHDISVVRASE